MRYTVIAILFFSGAFVGACSLLGGNDDDNSIIPPPGTFGPSGHEFPRWSPDGQTILYYNSGYRENSSGGHTHYSDSMGIWAVDINGENNRMLLPEAYYADWSPDGEWIVFGSRTQAQIFKLPYDGFLADTSAVVPLASVGRFPNWSPDGQWITYNRSIEDDFGPSGVWRMYTEGNNKEHVFGAGSPNWHPDGDQIIGTVGKRFEIYTISTGESVILNAVIDDYNEDPRFSPDGNNIVFESYKLGQPDQVWVMDNNGENLQQLTTKRGIDPDWSPDGTQIVYIGPNGGPWIMNADGSNKREVLESAF